MLKKIFAADGSYKELTDKYEKTDGFLAIGFYAVFMVLYYITGVINAKYHIHLGIEVNFLLAALCIAIVLVRKQKLRSVGITAAHIKKSFLVGSVFGLAILIINVIAGVSSGHGLNSVWKILYTVFYYFIAIAFVEELTFRGFIQTRLYGIIRNDIAAVLITGILFSAMHIPYQMAAANMTLSGFLLKNCVWLLLLFGWHIVFNLLYRKYNSVWTGTIFHGFMDWSNSLFF